jgi:hypothetical protein
MLLQPSTELTISEMDSLFPREPHDSPRGKAEEALHSHLIIGFEEVLDLGMPPMEALGHVLCWVATEMARIKTGQGPQSRTPTPLPKVD